jgi:hypothetical protein
MGDSNIIPIESIENKIFVIRSQKVLLDKDLAQLYRVTTFNLNKAVKRNLDRFPSDFMFQLTKEEFGHLIFQFGISKKGRGGTRKLPFAFTEQGVEMLLSVLRSKRAVLVNIQIMRAFVKLREILSSHKELANKLEELELKIDAHDQQIVAIFEAINLLLESPEKPKRKIGFDVHDSLRVVREKRIRYGVKQKRNYFNKKVNEKLD